MLELETAGYAAPDESLQWPAKHDAITAGFDMTPVASLDSIKAAKRHTARVRVLRRVAIGGSILAIALIAGATLLNPLRRLPVDVSIGGVGVEGTKVTVDSPKISGVQTNGSPFDITARSGIQDITTPNVIELVGVDSKIGSGDSSTTRVSAAHGVYDSSEDKIDLDGDVRIKSSSGYDLSLETARIDFKTGGLVSDRPVKVNLEGGIVTARQIDVSDHGHKVSFDGDVTSLFDSEGADPGTAPAERVR